MAETTIISSTAITQPSGSSRQAHVIYAANSARWWLFYLSAANTLATLYSSDGVTWTVGGTLTLSANSTTGGEIAVAYANISATDVVHIAHSPSGSLVEYHCRATISGTSISFGSLTNWNATSNGNNGGYDASVAITSGGYIGQTDNAYGDGNTTTFPNADAGSHWTVGTPAAHLEWSAQNSTFALAMLPLGTNGFLFLCDDGSGLSWGGTSSYAVQWGTYNGTSWSTATAITGYTKTSQVPNDWGACKVSDTDFHLVHRTGTNTYEHLRFNGTSWSAGQTIPAQTSLAGGGFAMTSDGTSVWLFIIDSASGNAIRYIKWNGTAWDASWSTLESTSATRTYISVCPQIANNAIQVIWTEGSASPYSIAGEQLSLGTAGANYNQSVIDATSGTDSSVWSFGKRLLDAESGLDALIKKVIRSLFDPQSGMDSTTKSASKALGDATSGMDLYHFLATKSLADADTLTDTLRKLTYREFLDTLSALDSATASTLSGKLWNQLVSDHVSALDVLQKRTTKLTADQWSSVDLATRTWTAHLLMRDLTSVVDAVKKTILLSWYDEVILFDAINALTLRVLFLSDYASLHDSFTRSLEKVFADAISAGDLQLKATTHSLLDIFVDTDTVTLGRLLLQTVLDTVGFTDSVTEMLSKAQGRVVLAMLTSVLASGLGMNISVSSEAGGVATTTGSGITITSSVF